MISMRHLVLVVLLGSPSAFAVEVVTEPEWELVYTARADKLTYTIEIDRANVEEDDQGILYYNARTKASVPGLGVALVYEHEINCSSRQIRTTGVRRLSPSADAPRPSFGTEWRSASTKDSLAMLAYFCR